MIKSIVRISRNISRFFRGVLNLFLVIFFGRNAHNFGRPSHIAGYHVCPHCGGKLQRGKGSDDPPLVCCVCHASIFDSPQPVAVALLVRYGADDVPEILVGRRIKGYRSSGKMTFPCGFVEPGESAEDAAARETGQEVGGLGRVLDGADCICLYSETATTRNELIVFVLFESDEFNDCRVFGTEEISDPTWVRLNDPTLMDEGLWAFDLHCEAFCALSDSYSNTGTDTDVD